MEFGIDKKELTPTLVGTRTSDSTTSADVWTLRSNTITRPDKSRAPSRMAGHPLFCNMLSGAEALFSLRGGIVFHSGGPKHSTLLLAILRPVFSQSENIGVRTLVQFLLRIYLWVVPHQSGVASVCRDMRGQLVLPGTPEHAQRAIEW